MTKIHRVRKHFLLDLRHKTAFWNHAYNRKIKIYRQILQLCDSIGDKGFFFYIPMKFFHKKLWDVPLHALSQMCSTIKALLLGKNTMSPSGTIYMKTYCYKLYNTKKLGIHVQAPCCHGQELLIWKSSLEFQNCFLNIASNT